MKFIFAIAPIDAAPGAVLLDPSAAARFGETVRTGAAVFLARRRGEVAVCVRIDAASEAGDGAMALHRHGGIGATALLREENGLTIVDGIALHAPASGAVSAWLDDTPTAAMPEDLRAWRGHAIAASQALAAGLGFTLAPPAGSRPAGRGAPAEIAIEGEIDDALADSICDGIASAAGRTIRCAIDSGGGDVQAGRRIYEALTRHPHRVETHVTGEAASMAAIVALAGDTRTAFANAEIMLHRPQLSNIAAGGADKMRAHAARLDDIAADFGAIVQLRTGVTGAEAAALLREERRFAAGEALALGFIHQVLHPDDGVTRGALVARGLAARPARPVIGATYRPGAAVWDTGRIYVARCQTFVAPGSMMPSQNRADWIAARPDTEGEIAAARAAALAAPEPAAPSRVRRRPRITLSHDSAAPAPAAKPSAPASAESFDALYRKTKSRLRAATKTILAARREKNPQSARISAQIEALTLELAALQMAIMSLAVNSPGGIALRGVCRKEVKISDCVVQNVRLPDGQELDVVTLRRP